MITLIHVHNEWDESRDRVRTQRRWRRWKYGVLENAYRALRTTLESGLLSIRMHWQSTKRKYLELDIQTAKKRKNHENCSNSCARSTWTVARHYKCPSIKNQRTRKREQYQHDDQHQTNHVLRMNKMRFKCTSNDALVRRCCMIHLTNKCDNRRHLAIIQFETHRRASRQRANWYIHWLDIRPIFSHYARRCFD